MENKTIMKTFLSGGVLPILKMGDGKRYLILVKRSVDAKTNSDSHSGFFGWADNKKEESNPEAIAYRELLEELFIISKNQKRVFNLFFKDDIDPKQYGIKEPKEHTEDLIAVWNKEKGFKIAKDISSIINEPNPVGIECIDGGKAKKVYIAEFNFSLNFGDIALLDGEAKQESPAIHDLLDREINVFDLDDFKEWWCENKRDVLKAEFSFQGGKPILKGFIDRKSKNKISPVLLAVLNQWLYVEKQVEPDCKP